MKPNLDRLLTILSRAKLRASNEQRARKLVRNKRKDKLISEDFADRLAERHKYRQLLSDERLDGYRFRFYFLYISRDVSLDELRSWIDSKIAEAHEHEKARKRLGNVPQRSPSPADSPPSA